MLGYFEPPGYRHPLRTAFTSCSYLKRSEPPTVSYGQGTTFSGGVPDVVRVPRRGVLQVGASILLVIRSRTAARIVLAGQLLS